MNKKQDNKEKFEKVDCDCKAKDGEDCQPDCAKIVAMKKRTEKKSEKKIVKPYDGKYKVTFITNQMFKGLYRAKGTSMIVPAHVAKAYKKRPTLEFKPLKK